MTIIDCAQNDEITKELNEFLQNKNHIVTQENDIITTDKKISQNLLEQFLKETDRPRHKVLLSEPGTFVIAIPVKMEDIGLESCEFCGYTAHSELVNVHRRTHQGL